MVAASDYFPGTDKRRGYQRFKLLVVAVPLHRKKSGTGELL
jgi:hypothetical protein